MASSTSDTAPPIDSPTTEEPVTQTTAEPAESAEPVENGKPAEPAEPAEPEETAVDPLKVPLPQEWTTKELIAKKREEKGPAFACAFACCCCFLCYERLEFVLDYLFCKTQQSTS